MFVMTFVGVLRLEYADAPGQGDAKEQSHCERKSIVGVKRDLRQQISQCDAKENTCSKCQGAADRGVLLYLELHQAPGRAKSCQRTQYGEDEVRRMNGRF